MSTKLEAIAARYAAALSAADKVSDSPRVSDERQDEQLRMIVRYGVGINHLATVLDLQGRDFGSVTEEEWEQYVGSRVHYELPRGREIDVGYITAAMRWLFPDLPRQTSGVWAGVAIAESALPELIEQMKLARSKLRGIRRG